MVKFIADMLGFGISDSRWQEHVDAKFHKYTAGWLAAHLEWYEADERGDRAAAVAALEQQALYLRAEELAHRDMTIEKSKRRARWDADYVAEARLSIKWAATTDLTQRLSVVEDVMAQHGASVVAVK